MGRRRNQRDDHEFDDTIERSHGQNKRMKRDEPHPETVKQHTSVVVGATLDEAAATSCHVDDVVEATKIEHQRCKNKLRKERKKEKAQERLKEEKERQDLNAARANATPPVVPQMQEVVSCRKGVQYQDIVLGKGPMVQDRKKIHVKYTLRKQSATGKILDSSDMFGFRIGKGEVIQGWDIGLEGMKQGGIRHLLIPPEAGYGQKDIGAGKGGMLFFKVTLLAC